jgi:hypothetical protein
MYLKSILMEANETNQEKKVLRFIKTKNKSRGSYSVFDKSLIGLHSSVETKAGVSKLINGELNTVSKKELYDAETLNSPAWNDLPSWLKSHLDCRTEEHDYMDTYYKMLKQLREKPTEANLRLMNHVLNEIGKINDDKSSVLKIINQKLINEFQLKEEGKK